MTRRIPHVLSVACIALLLGACSSSETTDAATPAPAAAKKPAAKAPEAAAPAATPAPAAASIPSQSASFTAGLPAGAVIRATCEMGTCDWLKVLKVERAGIEIEPKYNFDFQRGNSNHSGDYPPTFEGVDIKWTNERPKGVVVCSRENPYASIGGQGDTLKLNPGGVPGAMQTPANVYFAACHGESGNDGELATKFGYDLK